MLKYFLSTCSGRLLLPFFTVAGITFLSLTKTREKVQLDSLLEVSGHGWLAYGKVEHHGGGVCDKGLCSPSWWQVTRGRATRYSPRSTCSRTHSFLGTRSFFPKYHLSIAHQIMNPLKDWSIEFRTFKISHFPVSPLVCKLLHLRPSLQQKSFCWTF